MKDEDFIERKEKVLLAALGKSWLWKASRLIIGIIPPVGAFVMLVHCTLLSFGIRVTDTYINADLSRVDEANRRVIDYVLYNKK